MGCAFIYDQENPCYNGGTELYVSIEIYYQKYINEEQVVLVNPFKSDIFSLGLVILELILMCNKNIK